jgi:hypothetical protein
MLAKANLVSNNILLHVYEGWHLTLCTLSGINRVQQHVPHDSGLL